LRVQFDRAIDEPVVTRLREALPEFEPVFKERLSDEAAVGVALSSFGATGAFGEWVLARLHDPDSPVDLIRRAFAAVEDIKQDPALQMGDDLAAEFYETVGAEPRAWPYLPSTVRQEALRCAASRGRSRWSRLWWRL